MKTESVIDFPKATLCPEIWEKVVDANGMNEIWQLKPEVKAKIMNFIQKLADLAKLQFPNEVHITGSITSNSYTENADIDIHILKYSIREPAKITQNRFVEAFKIIRETDKESTYIGTHPFEVYYQDNEFQDYMSVGCYDFLKDEWLVGPELIDQSFNPYSEYYKEVQEKSERLANNIRNTIFSIYEMAVVLKKNINNEFGKNIRNILISKLQDAKNLFENIRQTRKIYSSPESIEQALKYRSSRKWKIADASFKLFDKYGYTAILRRFVELLDILQNSNDVDIEIIDDILSTIKNYINNVDKLSEQELHEDEQVNEGMLSNIAIASLLAIGGILPAEAIADTLNKLPKQELKISSPVLQDEIAKLNDMRVGKYSATNTVNIIAWTLYGEAGGQSKKGKEGVASVILNMAGGKSEKFVDIIFKPGKFSMWKPDDDFARINKLKIPTSEKDYIYKPPAKIAKIASEKKSWDDAVEIATRMVLGKFKSTIGDRNAYLNLEVTKRKYPNSDALGPNGWYNKMTQKLKIEDHTFGYLPENDGYMLNKIPKGDLSATTYTVKSGDSLWKIAYMFDTTVKNLKALNQNINFNKPLRIGQIIKLKATPTYKQQTQKTDIPAVKQNNITNSIYTVKKGDSLWKIGKKFNISVSKLAELNGIDVDDIISIGQKIKVKDTAADTKLTPDKQTDIIYTVKKGDSLWKISKKFNTSIDKLTELNGIDADDILSIGQKLKVSI